MSLLVAWSQLVKKGQEPQYKNIEVIEKNENKITIRGAFLGAGSINNPENNYHYYLHIYDNNDLQNLILSLHEFDFPILVYTEIKDITINDIHQLIKSRT